MVLKAPWILILIPFVLGMVYILHRRKKETSFSFPSANLLSSLSPTWKVRFLFIPFVLRLAALALFIFALAGPRAVLEETKKTTEGIDIVLAIDASGSMAAEDFMIGDKRLNRLDVVKEVVKEFIANRTSDQIGFVAFGGLAYTVCPLTMDTSWLQSNLERIELGLIEDGTAVGSAIASSVARLRNSKAESKVIIILTDGINNAGEVDPITAAKAAATFKIKIYTIGAGTKGYAPFPTTDLFGRKVYQKVLIDIDEAMLKEVARITGGRYYRATDTESLREIYKEIDTLEKTKKEEIGYYQYDDLFDRVLLFALLLLAVEIILKNTVFLKVP